MISSLRILRSRLAVKAGFARSPEQIPKGLIRCLLKEDLRLIRTYLYFLQHGACCTGCDERTFYAEGV